MQNQLVLLQQQMYVAHGAFYDAIEAYRAAQTKQAPVDVLLQAIEVCQTNGERFELAISRVLHYLHGLLRTEERDMIAAQAQHFRDQLRAEYAQLTNGQK